MVLTFTIVLTAAIQIIVTGLKRTSRTYIHSYVTYLTDRPVLTDAGHVSAEQAKEYAETEFEKYRVIQDKLFQSDFDRFNNDNLIPLDIE